MLKSPVVLLNERFHARHVVRGVAVHGDKLLVAQQNSNEIMAFNAGTFEHAYSKVIQKLDNPCDIIALNGAIYVSETKTKFIHKTCVISTPGDKCKPLKPDTRWKMESLCITLSSTPIGNILASCSQLNKLIEFTPAGKLVRKININYRGAKISPAHAIQTKSGGWVVCDKTVQRHGILKLDKNGDLEEEMRSYEDLLNRKTTADMPQYVVTYLNYLFIVADQDNDRIWVLSSNLEPLKQMVGEETNALKKPFRMHIDERNRRLYVVEEQQNRVAVLSFS